MATSSGTREQRLDENLAVSDAAVHETMNLQDSQDIYHIVVCGLLGVGKKNIVCRICRDHFHNSGIVMSHFMHDDYDGVSFSYHGRAVDAHFELCLTFPVHLTNVPSISRLLAPYVRCSDATLLVYDVTNRASFDAVQVLHRIAREVDNPQPSACDRCSPKDTLITPSAKKLIIIMANKCDLPEKDWAVERKEAQDYCDRNSATILIEVSAKTGVGLEPESVLSHIVDQIYLARFKEDSVAEEEKDPSGLRRSFVARFDRFMGRMKGRRNKE